MKINKSNIYSAESDSQSSKSDVLDDMMDELEDNFDYVMSGLDRLDRNGDTVSAMKVAESINSFLDNIISEIGSEV